FNASISAGGEYNSWAAVPYFSGTDPPAVFFTEFLFPRLHKKKAASPRRKPPATAPTTTPPIAPPERPETEFSGGGEELDGLGVWVIAPEGTADVVEDTGSDVERVVASDRVDVLGERTAEGSKEKVVANGSAELKE
ncbi:hypothetical protein FQN50_008905, partial [Emmonsiellopsis sp. PD_5]